MAVQSECMPWGGISVIFQWLTGKILASSRIANDRKQSYGIMCIKLSRAGASDIAVGVVASSV